MYIPHGCLGEEHVTLPDAAAGGEVSHQFRAASCQGVDDRLAACQWFRLAQVGSDEFLFSESGRLAAAAADAGVDVTLQVGDGLRARDGPADDHPPP
jgi:hypothetical protein